MPNALLVYPKFPPSYWGMQYALEFVGKKSAMPPLGLLTVAAMFPKEYSLRVRDMNVRPLTEADLEWADVVFTSTMIVQEQSLREVIDACGRHRLPVVAGGPHPTTFFEDIEGVSHFVLGEVEDTFPEFLRDLKNGVAPKMYRAPEKPDVTRTPPPRYDLIRLKDYQSMALQFSRGCPFDCEFCDITKLFGRIARTKTNSQVMTEFDQLYRLGWRGPLFLVDDNFIGNKKAALDLLPEVAEWQKKRDYPFSLFTEASVNLARMDSLMNAMVEAGFTMTFLGIESPNAEALLKTKKGQNVSRGKGNFLLEAVQTIQAKGIEVTGGFILGLDGDRGDVFDNQIDFIQEAGIPLAMVGLLTAVKGTDLYARLEKEGRLLDRSQGDNVSFNLNFSPEMDKRVLLAGYKRVLKTLYDPSLEKYFERCERLLERLKPSGYTARKVRGAELIALAMSVKRQLFSRQGPAYLKFIFRVLRYRPRMFPEAIRLAIMGYHFAKITSQQIAVHEFRDYVSQQHLERLSAKLQSARVQDPGIAELEGRLRVLTRGARERYTRIHADFRHHVSDAWESFQETVQAIEHELGRYA